MENAPQEPTRPGLLQNVLDLVVAPEEGFVSLLRRPRVLVPLLALIAIQIAFNGVWLRHVKPADFLRTQMEEAGQWERIPAESRSGVLERQQSFFPVFAWGGALLGPPILVVVVGAVYLFVFRFFYASEVAFQPALAIVAHVFLVVGLFTAPLTLLVLFLRGDWNVPPQTALQANLSLLLGERGETSKFLWSFAESLDLFSLWALALLAVGFAAASARRWTAALAGVVAPWALYVLVKSGLAALF